MFLFELWIMLLTNVSARTEISMTTRKNNFSLCSRCFV